MGKIKEVDRKARAGEPLTPAETDLMIGKIIEDQQTLQNKKLRNKHGIKGFIYGALFGAFTASIGNLIAHYWGI